MEWGSTNNWSADSSRIQKSALSSSSQRTRMERTLDRTRLWTSSTPEKAAFTMASWTILYRETENYQPSSQKPRHSVRHPVYSQNSCLLFSTAPTSDPFCTLHRTIHLLQLLSPDLNTTQEHIAHTHRRLVLKLVVNCCVNPLTVIYDCKNGDLLSNTRARKMIKDVCAEAAGIIAKMDVEAHDDEPENRLPYIPTPTTATLEEEVLRVIQQTADNHSSMLVDVRRCRETEIEYINGYLTRLGQAYDVPTPTCQRLLEDVQRIRKFGKWRTAKPKL